MKIRRKCSPFTKVGKNSYIKEIILRIQRQDYFFPPSYTHDSCPFRVESNSGTRSCLKAITHLVLVVLKLELLLLDSLELVPEVELSGLLLQLGELVLVLGDLLQRGLDAARATGIKVSGGTEMAYGSDDGGRY